MNTTKNVQYKIRNLAKGITDITSVITIPVQPCTQPNINALIKTVLGTLTSLCFLLCIQPQEIVMEKMKINKKKYDEKECRKRKEVVKWTELSHITGVNSDTKLPMIYSRYLETESETKLYESFVDNFDMMSNEIYEFALQRNWITKYNEQSLALSLIAEVGELAEVFQWKEPTRPTEEISNTEKNEAAIEIADIAIYLLHLCRVLSVKKEDLLE